MLDDFVISSSAALRGVLRYCGVRKSTLHPSVLARLAPGTIYFVVYHPCRFRAEAHLGGVYA